MANVLITGASSGIGAALAVAYAASGNRLVLFGRNAERLAATAHKCRAHGVVVDEACFDLTEFERLVAELGQADARHPIDIAILNAGLGGSVPPQRVAQDWRNAQNMAGVNFAAPVVAANLLAERMAQRGRGRIVLIGSVAGHFPLPMAPAYAATKAGLALFADALRLRLMDYGVGVTLVTPGFVDTPMSRALAEPKPFLIDADRAAAIMMRRIARGARRITVPWQFAVLPALLRILPRSLIGMVLRRVMRRTAR